MVPAEWSSIAWSGSAKGQLEKCACFFGKRANSVVQERDGKKKVRKVYIVFNSSKRTDSSFGEPGGKAAVKSSSVGAGKNGSRRKYSH